MKSNNSKKNNLVSYGRRVKQTISADNPALTKLEYRLAKQRESFGIATPADKELLSKKPESCLVDRRND